MSEASGGLGRPRNPMSEASGGLGRPRTPQGEAPEALQYRVHMFAKVASLRESKSGVEKSQQFFACVGLPCARFSHVDQIAHFHKKAACGGRGSQFSALSACLWAPSKKREIEPKNRRIRGPKIGAARRTQFWGRGFTTPVFSSKLYCRNWAHFAAPFLGPRDGPVFWPRICARATGSRWLRPCPCSSNFGQRRGERTGGLVRSSSVRVFIMLQ